MGTITNTIGTAGGRDFSTLSAWGAALPANLVTDGNSYVGACYNDSEFTGSGILLTLSGHTTDVTHTITLTTGAGQSFRDNASVQTNALRYNVANGVGFRKTADNDHVLEISDSYVTLSNVQLSGQNGGQAIYVHDNHGCVLTNCIFSHDLRAIVIFSDGSSPYNIISNSLCLILVDGDPNGVVFLQNTSNLYFVTIVTVSDGTPGLTAIAANFQTITVENCAFFGSLAVGAGSSTFTFTTCMTDVASPPSGCTTVTYANQFQNTTAASADFREKAGANLQGAGTADSTFGATDIAGTARPQSGNWDIGCWELLASGTIVTADAWVPIELLATQRIDPSLPVEFIATQRADFGMLLERLGIQRADRGLLFDAMATQRAESGLVLEAAATLYADPRTPLELVAVLGSSLGLPVELGRDVTNDTTGRVESLAEALAARRVVTEWLASLLRDAPAPSEFAAIVARDAPETAEWLGAIVALLVADAVLPIEWSALPAPMRVSLERLLGSPGKRRLLKRP